MKIIRWSCIHPRPFDPRFELRLRKQRKQFVQPKNISSAKRFPKIKKTVYWTVEHNHWIKYHLQHLSVTNLMMLVVVMMMMMMLMTMMTMMMMVRMMVMMRVQLGLNWEYSAVHFYRCTQTNGTIRFTQIHRTEIQWNTLYLSVHILEWNTDRCIAMHLCYFNIGPNEKAEQHIMCNVFNAFQISSMHWLYLTLWCSLSRFCM